MATYTLAPNVKRVFFDNSGNVLSLGKIYTVEAGGTYPADAVTTYQTSSGTAHTNPIILDSAGRISGSSELYFEPGQSYKLIAASSSSDYTSPLWTQDGIGAIAGTSQGTEFPVTLGQNVDAGNLLYLSDGSAITAGTWGKADADNTYSSTLPELAFAVTSGTSGNQIQARQGGIIELSGLTPGTKYYCSATAGGVTSTAPVNARYVGQAISSTQLVINNEIADSATNAVVIDPRIKSFCQGRLSLTTGVAVTTADVTAAGTLYWVPYQGNGVALYSGTRWVLFNQAQLSIAVPAAATQTYDAFVDYNSGTPALTLTAWTNDTTRATALTTQDGVLVLTGTLGKRYVGTVRTVSASQLNDSFALRHVWNYYHRQPRVMRVIEATNSWQYTLATWRQANAAATNQLDFVVGVAEVPAEISVIGAASNAGAISLSVGIGYDSTTAPTAGGIGQWMINAAGVATVITAQLRHYPAVGRHVYVWLEQSEASGLTTWLGDNGGSTTIQSGIHGEILG